MELRVNRKYRLSRKIGSGSFGDIYLGVNVTTGEEVAIKLESTKTRHPQLLYESKIYRILYGGIGIPNVRWFGIEGDYNVMVLDLLGPSLEDLFNYCNRTFKLKTVLLLANQLLTRLEFIHTKSFIHRDVKPDNFLIGPNRLSHVVYIIDFGLAKRYRDPRTHRHIPYREHKNLTGTARYASINTHIGIEQSRRDDLESLGYVLMYFLRGSLPWQGLKAHSKKQKYERILEKKMATSPELLCRGFPTEFRSYFEYCRALRFDDRPDYSYLKRLFSDLFQRKGYEEDHMYDWTVLNAQHERTRHGPERSLGPLNGDGENGEGEQGQQIPQEDQAGTSANRGLNISHDISGANGTVMNTTTDNNAIEDSKVNIGGTKLSDGYNNISKKNTSGTHDMYNISDGNTNQNRFVPNDITNGRGVTQQAQSSTLPQEMSNAQMRNMGSSRNSLDSNGINNIRGSGMQNLPPGGDRNSSKNP